MSFREFSAEHTPPCPRTIDSDAPSRMRNELIDLFFHLAERIPGVLDADTLYRIICQSIGVAPAGQPYGGYRYSAGRDLLKSEWPRVYDLIGRVWSELPSEGVRSQYRSNVNRVLSSCGVVWELSESGAIQRYLPDPARSVVTCAIAELRDPQYSAGRELLTSAIDAFDARPRKDRDACSNAFDAMESVAKVAYSQPNAVFRKVLDFARPSICSDIVSVLERINDLRNHHFGHGMTTPFKLSSREVDFTYLSCIGGILLMTEKRNGPVS
jgi:hypothetical protein